MIAVNKHNNLESPSSLIEKLLPNVPSHGVENESCAADGENATVITESASPINETSKAHVRTALSFFKKNDSKPPINGTRNNNKTIILKSIYKEAKTSLIISRDPN